MAFHKNIKVPRPESEPSGNKTETQIIKEQPRFGGIKEIMALPTKVKQFEALRAGSMLRATYETEDGPWSGTKEGKEWAAALETLKKEPEVREYLVEKAKKEEAKRLAITEQGKEKEKREAKLREEIAKKTEPPGENVEQNPEMIIGPETKQEMLDKGTASQEKTHIYNVPEEKKWWQFWKTGKTA
jgi:hypothetical protein